MANGIDERDALTISEAGTEGGRGMFNYPLPEGLDPYRSEFSGPIDYLIDKPVNMATGLWNYPKKMYERAFLEGERPTVLDDAGRVTGTVGGMLGDAAGVVVDPLITGTYNMLPSNVTKPINKFAAESIQSLQEEFPLAMQRVQDTTDTLSLIPLARVAAVALNRADLATPQSERGINEGSGDVIVPNFYGPKTHYLGDALEAKIQKQYPDPDYNPNLSFKENWDMYKSRDSDRTKAGANPEADKLRQILGVTGFVKAGSLRIMKNMFNPKSRALYSEYGLSPIYTEVSDNLLKISRELDDVTKAITSGAVTPDAMKILKERKKKLTNDLTIAAETAQSQMQQLANIRRQANAVAKVDDVPMSFAMRAIADGGAKDFVNPKKMGSSWFHESATKRLSPHRSRQVDVEESDFIQNRIEDVWGIADEMPNVRVIVKKPNDRMTGDHAADLNTGGVGSGAKTVLGDIFYPYKKPARKFKSVADLEETLKTQQGKLKKNEYTVIGSDSTGVYIQAGNVGKKGGKGKVEGGINLVMKVTPNGQITGYMSDVHDFLENAPVIGKLLKRTLPTKILAVTPPMQTSVERLMGKTKYESRTGKDWNLAKGPAFYAKAPSSKEVKVSEKAVIAQFQDLDGIKPSAKEVAMQTAKVAPNYATVGTVGMGMSNDEQ